MIGGILGDYFERRALRNDTATELLESLTPDPGERGRIIAELERRFIAHYVIPPNSLRKRH